MSSEEKLDWKLQFDLVGSGLQDARKEIDKLQGSLKAGQKAMLDLEVAGKKVQFEVTGAAEKASKLGAVVSGAATAFGALAAGIAVSVKALDAFGDRAIQKFGERMATLRAYTTLLGDSNRAEVEYGKARGLALQTDLTAKDTVGAQKALMVAGFRGGDLDRALLATLDVASMAAPEDRELTMKRLGKAFGDIRSKGKLQGEELKQLTEAGLGRGLILDELRGMGLKGDVEKQISGGNVNAQMGIAAIERAILKQFGTSKLGQYATGAAGSLSGLMSNRDEALDNILTSIDSEALPAMDRYKQSLRDQVDQLNVNTEKGQQVATVLQDVSNTSLALKTSWTEFATGFVDVFAKSYTKTMAALGVNQKGLDDLGSSAKQLGEVLGNVGEVVAVAVRAFDYLAKPISLIASGIEGFGIILASIGEMLADLMAGDFAAVKNDYYRMRDRFWGQGEYGPKGASAAARDAAAMSAFGDDSGAGTGGGSAPGYNPLGVQLRNFGATKKKGSGSSGKGIGGGGLGSVGGTFVPDYADLAGGLSLPGVGVPGAPPQMGLAAVPYAAEQQQQLATAMAARQRLELEWSGDIVIEGAGKNAGEIVDELESRILRRVGRFARTPYRAVT